MIYIGEELSAVTQSLTEQGYEINTVCCESDKRIAGDVNLVLRVRYLNKTAEVAYAGFCLDNDNYSAPLRRA